MRADENWADARRGSKAAANGGAVPAPPVLEPGGPGSQPIPPLDPTPTARGFEDFVARTKKSAVLRIES